VSLLAMDILGATDRVSVNIPSTLMQIIAPDEMRGWISAVSSLFKGASNEIGELRAGTMAALIDAVPAVLVGGIGTLIVMAVYWRAFCSLQRSNVLIRTAGHVACVLVQSRDFTASIASWPYC
jgi:hypothetical protein